MMDNSRMSWIHTKFTIATLASKVHLHDLLGEWWRVSELLERIAIVCSVDLFRLGHRDKDV
jgi:hypothetical protein